MFYQVAKWSHDQPWDFSIGRWDPRRKNRGKQVWNRNNLTQEKPWRTTQNLISDSFVQHTLISIMSLMVLMALPCCRNDGT